MGKQRAEQRGRTLWKKGKATAGLISAIGGGLPVTCGMDLIGIKTPLGMKVQGSNVEGIQQLASQIQSILSGLGYVRSVFSEKVAQGFYVNVDVNREEAAHYGLTIADVQTAVSPASRADLRHEG